MDYSSWKLSETLILLSVLLGIFLPCVKSSANSDYSTLVYKNCTSQQASSTHESHSQALSSLFQELLLQSSQSRFFKATAGGGDDTTRVSGLFQCRGDLTNHDCYNCVSSTLPGISKNLCSKAAAARIQLDGCYFRYETDEYFIEEGAIMNKQELLHKICGEKGAAAVGFEELRDEAFAAMESGVIDGHGFYSGDYGSVHVLGQCEGDLGGCACGECVSSAARIAEEECIGSISGQIYLDKCSISYNYYPYGVPVNKSHDKGGGSNAGKSVAIVLGGAAALFFGFIFLKFIKSFGKKDDI